MRKKKQHMIIEKQIYNKNINKSIKYNNNYFKYIIITKYLLYFDYIQFN